MNLKDILSKELKTGLARRPLSEQQRLDAWARFKRSA